MIDYHGKQVVVFKYEAGDGEPHRICKPCARMLPVSKFGKNPQSIAHKICRDCHRSEHQRRYNAAYRLRKQQRKAS